MLTFLRGINIVADFRSCVKGGHLQPNKGVTLEPYSNICLDQTLMSGHARDLRCTPTACRKLCWEAL